MTGPSVKPRPLPSTSNSIGSRTAVRVVRPNVLSVDWWYPQWWNVIMSGVSWIFDFDNHYYEAPDAFTRHQDPTLGNRGVRWADIDGRRRLLVGGTVNSYIANPTFNPVARPGSLYDWY